VAARAGYILWRCLFTLLNTFLCCKKSQKVLVATCPMA